MSHLYLQGINVDDLAKLITDRVSVALSNTNSSQVSPYLTYTQTREYLHISNTTLHDYINRGILEAVSVAGGKKLITKKSIEKAIDRIEPSK